MGVLLKIFQRIGAVDKYVDKLAGKGFGNVEKIS